MEFASTQNHAHPHLPIHIIKTYFCLRPAVMEPTGAAAMLNIAGAVPFEGISGVCVM